MAGRVTLLILMTGLFAAMWSSDQRETAPSGAHGVARRRAAEPAVRETALRRWQVSSRNLGRESTQSWTPPVASPASADAPDDLPAGTYLVVDADGRSNRIVIEASSRVQLLPLRDHFVSESNGLRRHWIRLTDAPVTQIATRKAVKVHVDWPRLWKEVQAIRLSRTSFRPSFQRLTSSVARGISSLRTTAAVPVTETPADSIKR